MRRSWEWYISGVRWHFRLVYIFAHLYPEPTQSSSVSRFKSKTEPIRYVSTDRAPSNRPQVEVSNLRFLYYILQRHVPMCSYIRAHLPAVYIDIQTEMCYQVQFIYKTKYKPIYVRTGV